MIKITFLCIIIAIGYIHCNISNNTNLPLDSLLTNAKEFDIKEDEQMKFFESLNLTEPTTPPENNKPDDINGYYSWLNFFKTSTSTSRNNITMPSNTTKKA